jgi:hypothetical protein
MDQKIISKQQQQKKIIQKDQKKYKLQVWI